MLGCFSEKSLTSFSNCWSNSRETKILVDEDFSIVEFLPSDINESYKIIGTNLTNYAFPLIRYDTGDLGIMLPKDKYPKKRDLNFPLIQSIIGRNTDIIKTNDGLSLFPQSLTGVFEFFKEIKQFQVVQNNKDFLIIKYIKSESFTNNILSVIEKKFRERSKTSMQIKWECVEKIPNTKSGKPQIIINKLLKKSLTEISIW